MLAKSAGTAQLKGVSWSLTLSLEEIGYGQ
jgi:hypothetical protein